MRLSVVFAVRNEGVTLLGTIFSFYEDLLAWLPPKSFEFVVVDNCGTDDTADVLQDKLRRWVRTGLLKVLRYDQRPGNVLARNVGCVAADGDVVIFADGHLSVADGLTRLLYEGASQGGVWHPSFQAWGDTDDIRCYGYDVKLKEKFWGNISRNVPKDVPRGPDGLPAGPYKIPMASHCCLAVERAEFLRLGGYGNQLRVYGGGEPLLDMKYWVCGSSVNMEPRALVRHCAFGTAATWREEKRDRSLADVAGKVTVRRGGKKGTEELTKEIQAGDATLHFARDYAWTNEDLHHNFMAAAYIVGGYPWLSKIRRVFWDRRAGQEGKPNRYTDDLDKLWQDVLRECAGERAAVEAKTVTPLDDLLAAPPWPV